MDIEQLAQLSAAEIGRSLARGDADPRQLSDHLLMQCQTDAAENVFITLTAERAGKQAAAAAARLKAGNPASPLDGVPIVLKDLIDLEGEITTAASDLFRTSAPASRDASCAAALDAAGMVFLGKTNLTEFAFSGIGLNPHFGTPTNPHDPETPRIPGGSSSGSAVAVAAGLAPCAIGTDTGGSVRVPSAFNGLTGYKTSEGRIDKAGLKALSPTLDTIGPMARSVEDCILLDWAMRAANEPAPKPAKIDELRFFVPETLALDDLDSAVAANFEASLTQLEAAGATIERGPCPIFARIVDLSLEHGSLAGAEAYAGFAPLIESEDVSRIDPRVVTRILTGKQMSARDLLLIQRARAEWSAEFAQMLSGRLTLMPTIAYTAPEIAPLDADQDLFQRTNLKLMRNTMLGNFLNTPGVSLPNGTDAGGLPTALLISSIADDDERLLAASLAVEAKISAR